jgi:hypothetical protein
MCYAIAAIQALIRDPVFVEILIRTRWTLADRGFGAPFHTAVAAVTQAVLERRGAAARANAAEALCEVIVAHEVTPKGKEVFEPGRQADGKEFYTKVLNGLMAAEGGAICAVTQYHAWNERTFWTCRDCGFDAEAGGGGGIVRDVPVGYGRTTLPAAAAHSAHEDTSKVQKHCAGCCDVCNPGPHFCARCRDSQLDPEPGKAKCAETEACSELHALQKARWHNQHTSAAPAAKCQVFAIKREVFDRRRPFAYAKARDALELPLEMPMLDAGAAQAARFEIAGVVTHEGTQTNCGHWRVHARAQRPLVAVRRRHRNAEQRRREGHQRLRRERAAAAELLRAERRARAGGGGGGGGGRAVGRGAARGRRGARVEEACDAAPAARWRHAPREGWQSLSKRRAAAAAEAAATAAPTAAAAPAAAPAAARAPRRSRAGAR